MHLITTSAALLLAVSAASTAHAFRLVDDWSGQAFFDQFNFETFNDPTHGYVNYVDRNTAQSQGLISNNGQTVFIRPDSTNRASGRGRNSVRLASKKSFNQGSLIIADIGHMPVGCGTWPAFWTVGPNWPNNGEIDILEGVNNQKSNQVTLHTKAGCTMAGVKRDMWAQPGAPNCDVKAPGQFDNQGCTTIDPNTRTYGVDFNNGGGGVYATLWDASGIKVFFWWHDIVPADVRANNPNPAAWGKPSAVFPFGGNCPASFFNSQQIIINLTFCGDWAGAVFGQMCPANGDCIAHVRDNPAAFRDAFWSFNSIKVFQP